MHIFESSQQMRIYIFACNFYNRCALSALIIPCKATELMVFVLINVLRSSALVLFNFTYRKFVYLLKTSRLAKKSLLHLR